MSQIALCLFFIFHIHLNIKGGGRKTYGGITDEKWDKSKIVPLMYLANLQLFVLQMTAGLAGTQDHTFETIHILQQLHFSFWQRP